MDAWNNLTSGSTITTGDAWEHLLAQGGGGVSGIQLVDSFFLETDMTEYELSIESPDFVIESPDFVIEIDSADFSVDIVEPSYELEI